LNISTPRTNNTIEVWHSAFKKTFETTRYCFHLLIEKLKNELDAIRIKSISQEQGQVLIRKQNKLDYKGKQIF
jgi:hypothetical protein